jgi:hypothetical protein
MHHALLALLQSAYHINSKILYEDVELNEFNEDRQPTKQD